MVRKEFIVTGQLKETKGSEKQIYVLHDSFFAYSENEAIEYFISYFKPKLEVVKILSVIENNYGN